MASARELHEELVLLTRTPESARTHKVSVEVVLAALHARLVHHAAERAHLPSAPLDASRERRSLVAGRDFHRNNVELSWPAESLTWRWPPADDFTAYDDMVGRDLPGLRVLGACWGMSAITHPRRGGGLLLTAEASGASLSPVDWGPAGHDHVRCLLGSTWKDVNDFLYAPGAAAAPPRSLANQPGFASLSVAGSIAAGGHGSSLGLGPLSAMVERIVMAPIDPRDRAPTVVTRADRAFDYFATHLGRLGPVVAVDLAVRPRYRIEERRELRVLGAERGWREELQELVEEATSPAPREVDLHSREIWIAPYVDDGLLVTVLGTRVRTDLPCRGTRPSVLRSRALQVLGQLAVTYVTLAQPAWIRRILRETVKQTISEPVVMEAWEGLDFGAPNDNPMAAIEMAMDLGDPVDASPLVRVIDDLEDLARTHGRYVFAPMGVRFVGQGPDHGLSPHQGRARTLHVEIPTFADERLFHASEVLPRAQRLLAGLGGRPHWGQRIYLSPAELRRAWPPEEIAAMRALVLERDKGGLFANELVDAFLGIT